MKNNSFGKNLKKFRRNRKMSQGALAKALDVRQTTISNYENDLRFPNADLLNKIAQTLNVSLDDLIIKPSKETLEELDYETLSNDFIEKIIEHKEKEAKEMIISLAKKGYDILLIYDRLLKKILYKVGDLWEIGKMTIPMEHHISHIVEEIIFELGRYNHVKEATGSSVLLITPGNEPHRIGLKIIKEYFRRYGWRPFLLEGSLPWQSLVTMINEKSIDLVCISVTMKENINQTKALMDFIKQSCDVNIMIGGQILKYDYSLNLLSPDHYYNSHETLIAYLEKKHKEVS